jgi:hypothetical protein
VTGNQDSPLYNVRLAVERIATAAQAARALGFPFVLTALLRGWLRDPPTSVRGDGESTDERTIRKEPTGKMRCIPDLLVGGPVVRSCVGATAHYQSPIAQCGYGWLRDEWKPIRVPPRATTTGRLTSIVGNHVPIVSATVAPNDVKARGGYVVGLGTAK